MLRRMKKDVEMVLKLPEKTEQVENKFLNNNYLKNIDFILQFNRSTESVISGLPFIERMQSNFDWKNGCFCWLNYFKKIVQSS